MKRSDIVLYFALGFMLAELFLDGGKSVMAFALGIALAIAVAATEDFGHG
jgi:ABC-type nickel/cobalt efflux system permease component RcnA